MKYRVKHRHGYIPERFDVVDADGKFVALFGNEPDAKLFAQAKTFDAEAFLDKANGLFTDTDEVLGECEEVLTALWTEVVRGEDDDPTAMIHLSIAEGQGKVGAYMRMEFWARVRRLLGKEPKA